MENLSKIVTTSNALHDFFVNSSSESMFLVIRSLDEWGMYVGISAEKLKDRKKGLLKLEKKNEVRLASYKHREL